jgi:HAMP domain-containing protein
MNVCAVCRSRNEAGATKCWSCGNPLVAANDESRLPDATPADTDEPSADERLANERLANERLAEERIANNRLANERLANERLAEERLANERLAAEQRRTKADELEEERRGADRVEFDDAATAEGERERKHRASGQRADADEEPLADRSPRGPGVNLLTKFVGLILLVLGIGLIIGGKTWHDSLQREARRQVLSQAQLMIASATAMRTYTEKQIQPVVGVRRDSEFHPQWVPFYAATQIFKYLSVDYPDYTYKEAALNPMNLRDRAVDWEADIINYFRDNPGKTVLSGERNGVTGRSLYLAHPIVAEAGCLECHSSLALAPPKMVSFYGTENGFGWKLNEVVGAQIVSVPMSVPLSIAENAFRAWLSAVGALALLTLLTVALALTSLVTRPVKRVTAAANEVAQGNLSGAVLPAEGEDEIGRLEAAFNRMRSTLSKGRRAK